VGGEGGGGGVAWVGGLISKKMSILRLRGHAHTSLTAIEKGLGKLPLDLSGRLLTHIELPRTY
jgi:hypothetical protein